MSQNSSTQAVWDPILQTWIYTDPATGNQFEWNAVAQTYVPRISEADLARQRAMYMSTAPPKPKEPAKRAALAPGAPASLLELATGNRFQKDHGESRIIEGEDGVKYVQPKVNKTIYVKGLPKDVTEEECVAFFSRAGVLKKDPETRKESLKLYHDEQGQLKGDGLVSYFRPESVAQAFILLHEAPIRPGFPILIEEAKFKLEPGAVVKTSRRRGKRKRNQHDLPQDKDIAEHSGDEATVDSDNDESKAPADESKASDQKSASKSKASVPNNDIPKVIIPKKKKKLYNQNEELGWDEKEQKHVILKHMFRPAEAQGDIHFYDELKDSIMEEASKLGHVESIKIFEGSPLGVVALKFATGAAAEKCIAVMNGRKFDDVAIAAEFYDGYTNYVVSENDESVAKRDAGWASWLEEGH
jgi:HIV Tat-specific factor 1